MRKRNSIAFTALLAAALIAMGGCASTTAADMAVTDEAAESTTEAAAEESAAAAETEDADSAATEEAEEPKTIKALPCGFDMDNLTDCEPNVMFTSDDFNWRGGNLTFEVYATQLYDTVDVNQLKVGDSIETGDGTVEVKTLDEENGVKIINQGKADEIMLYPGDGGTYEIMGYDDQPVLVDIGKAEVLLDDNIKLIDCTTEPGETVEVGPDEIKQYTEELPEERQTFNPNCTTVVIEGDRITEIRRVWVP